MAKQDDAAEHFDDLTHGPADTSENVSVAEIEKFSALADDWWDPLGSSKPLHEINPVRCNYIDRYAQVAGKTVLDIGCGGGLLCEGLAQRGAKLTGIDMAARSIEIARLHAQESKLAIDYQVTTAEHIAEQKTEQFDVVCCLEMLEHVPEPESVIRAAAKALKPQGWAFFSTINRTPKAYAMAILGAEYVLRLLPRGTHDFDKFIKPSELASALRQEQLSLIDLSGIRYNPLSPTLPRARIHASDVSVNYILAAQKH